LTNFKYVLCSTVTDFDRFLTKKLAQIRAKINLNKKRRITMKKSIFTLAMTIFSVMAMFSTAFAQYEDIRVVPRESETYAYGTVGIKLYLNSKGVWEKQMNPFNGTPTPGYDNPCWKAAEAMTQANTDLGSDGKTRYPSPWIFSSTGGAAPAKDYVVQGSAAAINFFQGTVGASATTTGQTTSPIMINGEEYVLVWSRTGDLFAFKLDQNRIAAIRGIVASDLF
jgi:hypothetical protein